MNKMIHMITLFGAFVAGAVQAKDAKLLKTFSPEDPTISKDLKFVSGENAWVVQATKPVTVPLFEVADPGVEQAVIFYRAQVKTEHLDGKAYLEMWCRFPGKGEFFSRDLAHPVSGSTGWSSYQTPFMLKKAEKPDLIKLNLVVTGAGEVWIKNVELLKGPLGGK